MNVALCKCGIDMTEHVGVYAWDDEIPEGEHAFDASGTKHRCEKFITAPLTQGIYLCPRPMYHDREDVACGPLTGKKLW